MQSLEIPVHASSLVALLKKPTAGSAAAASAGGLLLGEVKQEKPRCVVSLRPSTHTHTHTITHTHSHTPIRPSCLVGGALASVELRAPRPVCIERYEDSRALGRFVLRQKGETVAVGMVTEVLAG